jgi:hypothetical protein
LGDEWGAADDQPLARIVVRGDLGQVALVEERQLELARLHELRQLGRLERCDPGGALGLRQQLEVRLGDHAAVRDHDHALQREAHPQLLDL